MCLKSHINAFVYGHSGSGKTIMTKKAIEHFNESSRLKAIYIDCSLYQTTNAIFHEILLSLNCIVSSKSNYELTKRLKAKIRNLDSPLTICLDHFEHLKEIETLNRILSLGINLIIIAETYDSYRKLNQTIKASITSLIEIPSYTTDQVFDILINRAEEALEKYTYKEETIRKIAEASSGNVTLALNLLKSQALKAESEGKNSVDDVEFNFENNCPDDKLSDDERTIIKILKEWKSLPGGRLFDFYREQARYPKGERSFRNYMHSLCLKGLVKSINEKRGRIYEIIENQEVMK
ncbi:MAG: AAA family ATPase [Candidatus Aenigmarchaeota archaeon]|nr:AAA family ATPase [Candidatus Aenigmarchaeota archaeon]